MSEKPSSEAFLPVGAAKLTFSGAEEGRSKKEAEEAKRVV
jgi:hypothetical protein